MNNHEARRAALHDIDRGLLFEPGISLSPFAAWKARHWVETHFWAEALEVDDWPWLAAPPGQKFGECRPDDCGCGNDELEACYDLARKHKLVWFQTGKVAV